jgi:acetylglutamate kinase
MSPDATRVRSSTTVVKIGGSMLGAEDTTLEDVVALQRAGGRVVVVHGGGAMITDWLDKMGIQSEFVDGLRATNAEAIEVVVAVLRGVINAQLVGQLVALGGRAIGLCGVDGGLVEAQRYDPRLGYVGQVTAVDGAFLDSLLDAGVVPVIAPIGLERPSQPLNINADTVAGEVARAIGATQLVFLTDVDGLLDASGQVLPSITETQAEALRAAGTIAGGMIPKVEACFRAAEAGGAAIMANGRTPGTLRRIVGGERLGTRIGG